MYVYKNKTYFRSNNYKNTKQQQQTQKKSEIKYKLFENVLRHVNL